MDHIITPQLTNKHVAHWFPRGCIIEMVTTLLGGRQMTQEAGGRKYLAPIDVQYIIHYIHILYTLHHTLYTYIIYITAYIIYIRILYTLHPQFKRDSQILSDRWDLIDSAHIWITHTLHTMSLQQQTLFSHVKMTSLCSSPQLQTYITHSHT